MTPTVRRRRASSIARINLWLAARESGSKLGTMSRSASPLRSLWFLALCVAGPVLYYYQVLAKEDLGLAQPLPAAVEEVTQLPPPSYQYHAKVLEVYDGDTLTLDTDLGFDVHLITKVRLEGINTPEVRGAEKVEGLKVRDYVRTLLPPDREVVLVSKSREKYGRWLGRVYFVSEGHLVDLSQHLLSQGMAEEYP